MQIQSLEAIRLLLTGVVAILNRHKCLVFKDTRIKGTPYAVVRMQVSALSCPFRHHLRGKYLHWPCVCAWSKVTAGL